MDILTKHASRHDESPTHESGQDHGHDHADALQIGLGRLALALGLALVAEAIALLAPDLAPNYAEYQNTWTIVGMALAALAIGMAGLGTYSAGLKALRRGQLNINALMTVAVTGAFAIGQWPEAAMVMALYAIAELIEARAVDRARNAIKGLMALAPDEAEVRQADGSWRLQAAEAIAIGAVLRVKPGERLPLDGVVTAGRSAVDQASVTGESLPVDKAEGDPVFAGTVNQSGALEVRVTALASHSTLARIIHAVEQAQATRAPTQRFVDRFAAIYTPSVFVIAVGVAVFVPLLTEVTWLQALYKALVLLVIACPCALVISTPVTVVSGLAAAARRGILIKGGTYLEQARNILTVALDKTGTITQGSPRLVHWQALPGAQGLSAEADVIAWGASLAGRSDHPVSKAIAEGLSGDRFEVEDFEALPGLGVQGRVQGHRCVLSNHRLVHDRCLCSAALEATLADHQELGRTVTILSTEDRVLALFAVADTLKDSSTQAIAELKAMGVVTVMLTGDNLATARAIAQQAGITDVRGELMPQDKQTAINQLQAASGPTAMVGDGINDAPSLAQSDIGFAMGGAGTDIAMEAADVIIMNDDLRRVPATLALSRKTHRVLWQNISLALGIKVVFLVLAVFGNATMWMAVFADMGASLLVVANGLRLLRGQPR